MKKALRILTSYVLCAALCLSLAACGGSKDPGAELQKYIDENQEQIDQLASTMESAGLKLAVEVDGNSLVYKYQFTDDIGEDVESVKSGLEQAMDAQSSTFDSIVASLKEEISGAESIKVIYLDKDNNELYSKEFK